MILLDEVEGEMKRRWTDHSLMFLDQQLGEMLTTTPPLLCVAGTDEGEVVIVDWKTCTDIERGAGKIENYLKIN